MSQTFDVLIIGGGAAGITVAASLKRRKTGLNVGLIEPSQIHYYQPALTLVGAGVQTLGQNTRAELSLIPDGVNWIRDRVDAFDPERNEVVLAGGSAIGYEQLVICPGLVCAWDRVAGLAETLGQNSVSSNYSPEHAAYTWESLQNLGPGDGPAVFTQRRCRSNVLARRKKLFTWRQTIYARRVDRPETWFSIPQHLAFSVCPILPGRFYK